MNIEELDLEMFNGFMKGKIPHSEDSNLSIIVHRYMCLRSIVQVLQEGAEPDHITIF